MKRFFCNRIFAVAFMCACALALSTKPLYAIQDGDIVTISYTKGGVEYYFYGTKSWTGALKLDGKTTIDLTCLWIVSEVAGQYAFANLSMQEAGQYAGFSIASGGALQIAATPKAFTFTGTNSANIMQGTLVSNQFFIQENSTTQAQNEASILTIEKWELAGGAGGEVTGKFEPGSLDFGCNQTGNNEVKNLKFTLKQVGGAGGYYYCLNRDDVQIPVPAAANNIKEKRKAIELADISFKWRKNGNSAISKANCSTLADSEVKERDMLELSWEKSTTEEDTWNITVTAKGASPTNLVDANGDWIDYSDEVVATFRSKDSETTNRVSAEVKREAYHLQEWPTFDVGVSPTSYTFGKAGGQTTFTLTCIHQNGANIIKSDGVTKAGEIVRAANENVTNAAKISFAAKSMLDETTVNWLTVESISNGVMTVSASDNSQNTTEREARLVGVITYTDPDDANDTHSKTVVIPIKQKVKDGQMTYLPQKGYGNTEFGKNPYTGADEQMVHTAEKTIYYLPNEEITLRIAETSFNGYYRWYDYQTNGNPQYNAIESDRTTWATQPAGTLLNNSIGDTYGIYSINSEGGTIPVIKGWADGNGHIIACDISNYRDYSGGGTDNYFTEPTLSYRQLFHLRPAQEMAEKFKAAAAENKFLEYHTYTAPVGQNIYLTTDYRYGGGDESDKSYYYYVNGVNASGGYKCVGKDGVTAKWFEVNGEEYTDITPVSYTAKDYLSLTVSSTGKKVYELGVDVNLNGKIDDGDVRIARFEVNFVNDCGPSTTTLITRNDILNNYMLLEEIDFSFGAPAPGEGYKFLNYHLPWNEASYGYTYPEEAALPRGRTSGSSIYIPYWGEYYLLNKIPDNCASWAYTTENHGGRLNGYALYVDGTSEPGLVASISTDATVCSGQTMYCSMWLSNVGKSGVDPVFRCNIQGRNGKDEEWSDVGVFFVGAVEKKGGVWEQINFPVLSDKESYAETRVSIYNFATSAGGNDFMIDDICLYVSPLSLAAYQATMGCRAATNVEEASTAVVVRMDYTQLNPDLEHKWVYYQLNNITDNRIVKLKTLDGEGNVISAYYAENTENISDAFGSVQIPNKDYIPSGAEIVPQLEAHLHTLVDSKTRHSKCYVRDVSDTKWYLYMIHIIPNTQNVVVGDDSDIYLEKNKDYQLVIAHDPAELAKANCSSTTPIYPTTDTYIELKDTEGSVERVECRDELCANNIYFLNVRVENTFASGIGGGLETMGAEIHADWLVGEESDDVYCHMRTMTEEERNASNQAFEQKYGCDRHTLREAISHMRQMPSLDTPNPNYQEEDVDKLVTTSFFDAEDLALIKRLCAEGKLTLYKKSVQFYMGSEEIVRYWAYPVAQDASIEFNGNTYPLFDCDEPLWVKVQSSYSEYAVNLSPLDKENQTHKQRLEIPSVRILEGTTEVAIPIKELLDSTLLSTNLDFAPGRDTLKFSYHTPIPRVLEYVSITDAAIRVVEAPATLEVGEDYLMRMAFYDQDGNAYIQGDTTDCRVGYVYFYLSVVPKTVQWTGAVSNIWGDDGNWKGVRADGSLTDKGFAPMAETNVILPNGAAPIIQEEDLHPMDVNYSPHACNNIYFKVGSMVYNQHLLEYKKAFVDMQIGAANWNSMAPPLKGMYTGDMYVPHEGQVSVEYDDVTDHSNYPFAVSGFKGTRTSKAPYVFWQSLYNKRVTIYHENGNQSYPALTETALFAQTNSLGQTLPVGSGYQVLGFGPTRGAGDEIIVRLPKPDTYYSYFNKDGSESSQRVSVSHSNRLAFDPDQSGNMTITLTNDIASKQFMFGNPTMGEIDMAEFLAANSHILAAKYYTMEESAWKAENWYTITSDPASGMLAPMRSVMLELKEGVEAKKSITVSLSKDHMNASAPARQKSRRIALDGEDEEAQLMTIYANCDNGHARCMLASYAYASDIYNGDEDALFISSGVEQGVNFASATSPINMYTVSKQVPMMVDVREHIDTVPVSMLVHDDYRTEEVVFSFYLSRNWNKKCYFCDAVTGKRYRILDGLILKMEMPQNHENRYYIEGPDRASNNDVTTSTNNPSKPEMGAEINIWAYSPEQGKMVVASDDIMKAVNVYDLSGRVIAQKSLDLQYNSTAVSVPAGVYVVEAIMRDNSKQFTQAVVW
ncbi:MAG: T9SS type A sorting domain-containing protein [Paludibacteraceae bacterium]|nr:T9SS type A sorting domain-containing protein [Paludibacteraceae bacterium]